MLPVKAWLDPGADLRDDVAVKLWVLLWPILGSVSGAVLWIARASAQGRFGRNRFVGIRTSRTLKSDGAWSAAHVAAYPWMSWGGLVGVLGSLLLVFLRTTDTSSVVLITAGATTIMTAGVAIGARKGIEAANGVAGSGSPISP